ncbi:SDR family NAD(P)-dependent oxidoreductase [Paucilactobacillus nenjiangensis]|uniref:SDR family oxidoreductase n=1 Tax=Paucilactobacillus nenjiangensis TaxID=1296540 RepID=A0A5P1X3W5_9LACO|nr:SDR family NAD(P)-dependent oxidoreductase [Paucilactobacillus nenjiangensis]QER66998.1 SDR family oxidoreductase [Paucilactobacillus nenjiangensis]
MSDLYNLEGKVAIVTGASSGLGADAARAYAKAGADVALFARRAEKLEAVAKEIEAMGRKALPVSVDVSNERQVKDGVQKVVDTFGKVDILLNDAGVAVPGGVEDLTEEAWDQGMAINVKGPFLMSKYVVPLMRKAKYGKIVNIASVNAIIADKVPVLWRHNYNASKDGVRGLTLGMAASYAQDNITVNSIGPGLFESEMTENTLFKNEGFLAAYNATTPASRPGKRGELNGTILFFSSDASSYVTGQYVAVDGGASIV